MEVIRLRSILEKLHYADFEGLPPFAISNEFEISWRFPSEHTEASISTELVDEVSNVCFSLSSPIGEVFVYTSKLAAFLTQMNGIKIWNNNEGKLLPFNSDTLLKDYAKSFFWGRDNEFDAKWNPNLPRFKSDLRAYVKTLEYQYYKSRLEFLPEILGVNGWQFVRQTIPLRLSADVMLWYGMYAGMVSRLIETIEQYYGEFQGSPLLALVDDGTSTQTTIATMEPETEAEGTLKGLTPRQLAVLFNCLNTLCDGKLFPVENKEAKIEFIARVANKGSGPQQRLREMLDDPFKDVESTKSISNQKKPLIELAKRIENAELERLIINY